jgi:hypothetical protein
MEKKERINIIISVILILTAASLFFPLSSAFAGQFTGGIGDGDACAEVSLSSLATVPEVVSKIIRAGEEILSISRLNNKVTVVLTNPYPNNNLKPGQYIVIYTGISGTPSFNGRFLIDSVLSQSEFTYQQGGSNESGSIGSFSFAGGDFSTLTSWEADLPYDLASTGTPHIAVCYNDWVSGLKDNLVVEGHTTTPKYYIKITPFRLDRNTGKPKSGFFIAPSSGNAIILQDNADLVLDSIEATAPVVINAGVARVDDRSIY